MALTAMRRALEFTQIYCNAAIKNSPILNLGDPWEDQGMPLTVF
jgi:hypothetical protein